MSVFSASSLSASDTSFTRRVKPLPKRRRTSRADSDGDGTGNLHASPPYYHPIYSGRVNRLKQEFNVTPQPSSTAKSPSLPTRSRVMDDADGEGDYTDHLQQPNNTKKRKVPAAATVGPTRNTSTTLGDEDRLDDNISHYPDMNLSGGAANISSVGTSLDTPNLSSAIRQKKCSPVTVATLRVKQSLEVHRKTMAAVIQNDTDPLALELALSASFASSQPPRTWSRSRKPRRRSRNNTLSSQRDNCFSGPFTFTCVSPTSTRYALAKKAAASLQLRFQTELARQAANAAEFALKPASKPSGLIAGQRNKLESNPAQVSSTIPHSGVTQSPTKPNKTKKKKRSALANASNPHHLRNYVPSRIPQSNGHPPSSSAYGPSSNASLGPLALKFLSATLPPRRKGRLGSESLGPSLVRPESEWICPFCEYSLFYGDDTAMHRAVKNRRKVLRRRRKARERAAAAASGTAASVSQDISEDEESGEDGDSIDDVGDVAPTFVRSQASRAGVRQDNPGPHPGG
ncbi:hypothetical protein FRC08_004545 [Ceratobasidium sp. 394]|nr:hypothetical protein FRC08_004545 [Ceratobasidium sp. 394]KAG9099266.1 hypothetical protein FS749_001683 [Ceratobasidium sp. UAMH 11750]